MRFKVYSAVDEASLQALMEAVRRGYIMEITQIDLILDGGAVSAPTICDYLLAVRRARLQTVRVIEKKYNLKPWKKKRSRPR